MMVHVEATRVWTSCSWIIVNVYREKGIIRQARLLPKETRLQEQLVAGVLYT